MSVIRTKSRFVARVRQFIAGANEHLADGTQRIQVGGAVFTVASLTALLQSFVDARDAVEASKAVTRAKLEIERSQTASLLAVIRAFETLVRGTFGASADTLADFGLAPPKVRASLTAEEKAVAAAKRLATRAARGTTGKNRKKNVKGAIEARLVVTPVTTSPVAQPAAVSTPDVPKST